MPKGIYNRSMAKIIRQIGCAHPPEAITIDREAHEDLIARALTMRRALVAIAMEGGMSNAVCLAQGAITDILIREGGEAKWKLIPTPTGTGTET